MNPHHEKKVVMGISSGIAAYKILDLIELLKNPSTPILEVEERSGKTSGVDIRVIMTESATKMVDPKKFEKATGHKVHTKLFEKNFDYKKILKKRKVEHVHLADSADVFAVAPATANVIAKIANGLADDFLTTTLLATQAPVLICPSMNVNMWLNPQTQENINRLKKAGHAILVPDEGDLACGYRGVGRLPKIEKISDEIWRLLAQRHSLAQRRIVVTAGATREYIDDVRFITNRSSGKMGAALAEACHQRGAHVLLIRAANSVTPRFNLAQEIFETADDLLGILQKTVPQCDTLFHTAAVADFKVKDKTKGKISSDKNLALKLTPQKKIINQIKKINPKIKLVAFKAGWGLDQSRLTTTALDVLRTSSADAVVANDVSGDDRGFGTDTNEVLVVFPDGSTKRISLDTKSNIAEKIIDFILFN